jgi:tetratricopeptide (TPR) repeat protein
MPDAAKGSAGDPEQNAPRSVRSGRLWAVLANCSLLRRGSRVGIGTIVMYLVRANSAATALAAQGPDAGLSEQVDAAAPTTVDTPAASLRDGPTGPSAFIDTMCLSRYSKSRPHYEESRPSLAQAKWIWAHCKSCPDSWSKCNPCTDDRVLEIAQVIVGHLLSATDMKRAKATAAKQQVASASNDQGPHVPEQGKQKQQEALAEARSQYQEAVEYYTTALQVSTDPLLRAASPQRRNEVRVRLADLYFLHLDRPDLAAEHYRKLIGKKVDPEIVWHARLMLGQMHYVKGEWRQAEREFRAASLATKHRVHALCATYKQAWALTRSDRAGLARKLFRTCAKATRLDRPSDRVARSVGRRCADDEKRLYP